MVQQHSLYNPPILPIPHSLHYQPIPRQLTILEELLLLLQAVVGLGVVGVGGGGRGGGARHAQHVEATGGTGLLALEPGTQTAGVEDVVAGKLLAGRGHLLAADDADVVARRQLFRCGVRVPDQNASESGPRGVCLLTKTQNYLDRGMNYKSERHGEH